MRDLRPIALILVGIVFAGIAAWGVYGAATRSGPVATVSGTTTIYVAKIDLPAKTVVTPEQVAVRSYPADLVPTGAARTGAEVIGRTTIASIPAGAPLMKAQLVDAGGAHGESLTVDPGKVLVMFPTADPLTAAGLVQPGDRIDVLATVAPSADARATQTILQNLTVLDVVRPGKTPEQKTAALVFQVDPQVALVLKYLRDSQTTVDIAVRSQNASDIVRTQSVDLGFVTRTYGIGR